MKTFYKPKRLVLPPPVVVCKNIPQRYDFLQKFVPRGTPAEQKM